MKIFSWVHSRFHKKSVADEDAKKADEHDHKVSLLDQNEDVHDDGWKEGILAIGTLGIDLSKTFHSKDFVYTNNDQLVFFDHEDDDVDQEEELMEFPLMLKASKHGFHHVQKLDPSPCEDKVAKEEVAGAKHSMDLDTECTDQKKSGQRTTLADLLWGDSEKNLLKLDNKLCDHHHRFNVPNNYHVNTDTKSTNSSTLISKKKKIERDDHSTHPIKKTKRLMRKMLKKKIHPDMASQKKMIDQEIHVHAT